jgi:heterodisulfide reductase subunit A-like polyferredoxin
VNYCSRVCCTETMKNAIRCALQPGLPRDCPLQEHHHLRLPRAVLHECAQHGVVFMRYDRRPVPRHRAHQRRRPSVRRSGPDAQRWLDLPADLVVLSMPVVPAPGTGDLANMLRVPLSSEGFFAEAQMKLRPMDFMREGIFLAGMAHYPKFIEESSSHALAAAARALTFSRRAPSTLGGVVAEVDPDKCVGCLTCTRVCPFAIPQVIQLEGPRRRRRAWRRRLHRPGTVPGLRHLYRRVPGRGHPAGQLRRRTGHATRKRGWAPGCRWRCAAGEPARSGVTMDGDHDGCV